MWRRWKGRRVILHLGGGEPSVEGVLAGKHGGWFIIPAPKLHVAATAEPVQMRNPVEVPVDRVVFIEVMQ